MGRGDAQDLSEEYCQLLQLLRETVEGLLINQVSNVWNVYGGLNRLHNVMERIFKHDCRVFNQEGDPDCWIFIQGLSWLQPSLSSSPSFLTDEGISQLPPSVSGKALVWLYKSLEGHTLSKKLSWLLSDRDHLLSCFEKSAYLCQERYGEATVICLRAVEQNQPSLLTEIDPCLYLAGWSVHGFQRTHRKCSSFPETRSATARAPLLKRASADCQLIACAAGVGTAMPRVPTKKSPLGAGCFGSSIRDADRDDEDDEPEEDRQSLCEEATECTFANADPNGNMEEGDRSCNGSTTSNGNDDSVLSPGPGADKATAEATVKRWYSLPSLEVSPEPSRITSTPVQTTSSGGRGATHSYPSSPTHIAPSPILPSLLEPSTSAPEAVAQSPGPKLSPSVLEIDYSTCEPLPDLEPAAFHRGSSRGWRLSLTSGIGARRQLLLAEDVSLRGRRSSAAVLNTVITSSGSSDTLNADGGRPEASARPCNLRLSRPGSSPGGPCTELHSLRPSESQRGSGRGSYQHQHHRRSCSALVGSAPTEGAREWLGLAAPPQLSRRRGAKKSFIEGGGSSVLPMSVGFFPQPTQGQSLASFLSSGQFARPSAELDRENAHFSICEAMIAAIELVKCNRQLQAVEERGEAGEDSDEELTHLKQRIRLRRRQRQQERQVHLWGTSLLSDGKTDTTTTDQSISPLSSSPGTPSESISTDDVDDLEVDEVKNLAQLKNSGLSVSMASLYSEADLSRLPHARSVAQSADPAGLLESSGSVSAEGVALSLLRQFSDRHLPRASDLQWLVSEQDAPQQLLPLPTSWPVSPDEAEDTDMRQATPLRGTMEWAPPRPQVIFTPHPAPMRRVLMAKQNYRCAGCGMRVAAEYAHRFRYCQYLGRYFCTGCHTNQLALIPGRVLTKWDFTRCAVSNFSYRLLDQMMSDPLFCIADLNPSLYRRAKQLERVRVLRLQLCSVKDFIFNCRFADELQDELRRESAYLLTEPDVYSLHDLLQVRSGEMATRFRELVLAGTQHVADCPLCQARGFVCELCSSKEVIFPWQLGHVAQCTGCGACFHASCWRSSPCPRCTRRSARRLSENLSPDKQGTGGELDAPSTSSGPGSV